MREKLFLLFCLMLPLMTMMAHDEDKYFADFYVSPVGNDSWSGKLAQPNAAKTDGPFATVHRAKDAVRLIKNGLYRDIFVMIRGGEYNLKTTETFTAEDGHYDAYKVRYMAYPGEHPVFNSDIEIMGWKLAENVAGLPDNAKGKVYVADMPKLPSGKDRFYTLYENGRMMTRAHSAGLEPTKSVRNGGDGGGVDWKNMLAADRTLLYFKQGDVKNWPHLDDIELFVQPSVGYVTNYLTLASVDEDKCEAHTTMPATYPMGKVDRHLFAMGSGSYRVENVIDFLDKPGAWVLDTHERKVYFWPSEGKPGKVTVPGLVQYFLVDGHERGEIARNIAFVGLTFTRADRDLVTMHDTGLQHEWDMWDKCNAMLRFRDVEYCEVDGCRFTNSGSAAVRFDLHAQSNVVKNNLIDYVGGTGILLCGYGPGKLNENKCNRILNNQIHHCGMLYYQSNGIMVWQSGENIIRNNKIHNLPYDAIVLSGSRPMYFNMKGTNREMEGSLRRNEIAPEAQYQETNTTQQVIDHYYKVAPYSMTRNNLVEDNDIFCTMETMFDGNAIYLSDVGFGNVVHRNYIHHLHGKGMQQGIRTDAFIKQTTISQNIIYNCNGGGINVKLFENNVYNNIVADIRDIVYEKSDGKTVNMFIGYMSLLDVYDRKVMPVHTHLQVMHNIFYKTNPDDPFYRESIVNGKKMQVKLEQTDIDDNLYYDVRAKDKGKSELEYYRSRGVDSASVAADPLFVDIHHGDFRLKKNSPAYKIGFKDIDTGQIGQTNEFPAEYARIVKQQLGTGYDHFDCLEKLCRPTKKATSNEFKATIGI
jgi:hypothetical protein